MGKSHLALATGSGIVLALALCLIIDTAALTAGINPWHWVLPVAWVAAFAITGRLMADYKAAVQGCLIALLMMAIAAAVCVLLNDQSNDGNLYHQEITAALLEGWNPFSLHAGGESRYTIWTLYYAKGLETLYANLACLAGRLGAGKGINLLLLSGTSLIVLGMSDELGMTTRRQKLMLTLLVLANPVCILQMLVFYIDFSLYCYFCITLIALLGIGRCRLVVLSAALLGATTVLAIATKYNIFFHQMVLLIAVSMWCLATHRKRMLGIIAGVSALSLVLGLLICWHPYVTNYVTQGNAFYPLMGDHAHEIMSFNTPEIYRGHSRIFSFFRSIFAIAPLNYESRVAGLGPLFPILLVIAVLVFGLRIASQRGIDALTWCAIYVVLSCFYFEQSWWMRYISHLWLIVPLSYVAMQKVSERRCRRIVSGSIATLGCFTLAISIGLAIGTTLKITTMRHAIYTMLRSGGTQVAYVEKSNAQTERLLREQGFATQPASQAPANYDAMVPFYGKGAVQNFPEIRVSKAMQQVYNHQLNSPIGRLLVQRDPKVLLGN